MCATLSFAEVARWSGGVGLLPRAQHGTLGFSKQSVCIEGVTKYHHRAESELFPGVSGALVWEFRGPGEWLKN